MKKRNHHSSYYYWGLKDYDAALRELDLAIEYDPGFARAHNNRGVVYAALGRMDEAAIEFERALALDPKLAPAAKNLKKARRMLGD